MSGLLRRKNDRGPWAKARTFVANLRTTLLHAPIDILLLLGAIQLLAWAAMNRGIAPQYLWIYAGTALGMVYIAGNGLPPTTSLLVGLSLVWVWSLNLLNTPVPYTEGPVALLYVLVGVLVLHRSGR